MKEPDYVEIFIVTVKIVGVIVTAAAGLAGLFFKPLEPKAEPAVEPSALTKLLKKFHVNRKRSFQISVFFVIVTAIAQFADMQHELAQYKKQEESTKTIIANTDRFTRFSADAVMEIPADANQLADFTSELAELAKSKPLAAVPGGANFERANLQEIGKHVEELGVGDGEYWVRIDQGPALFMVDLRLADYAKLFPKSSTRDPTFLFLNLLRTPPIFIAINHEDSKPVAITGAELDRRGTNYDFGTDLGAMRSFLYFNPNDGRIFISWSEMTSNPEHWIVNSKVTSLIDLSKAHLAFAFTFPCAPNTAYQAAQTMKLLHLDLHFDNYTTSRSDFKVSIDQNSYTSFLAEIPDVSQILDRSSITQSPFPF